MSARKTKNIIINCIVKKIADTTKFSRKELLMPIVKVSEQMTELAKGAAEGAGEAGSPRQEPHRTAGCAWSPAGR